MFSSVEGFAHNLGDIYEKETRERILANIKLNSKTVRPWMLTNPVKEMELLI